MGKYIGGVILALVLGLVIGFLFSVDLLREHYEFIHNNAKYPKQNADSGWWGVVKWVVDWIPQGVMAAFAITLWYISRSQFRLSVDQKTLIEKANATAEGSLAISKDAHKLASDGLAETKRSVDAFIEAERGRIVVYGITIEKGGDNDPMRFVHFVMENFGRGMCTLTGDWDYCDFVKYNERIPIRDPAVIDYTELAQPFPSGRKFGTKVAVGVEHRIPIPMPLKKEGDAHFIIQIIMRYETSFGQVRYAGYTGIADVHDMTIRRVQGEQYNFDRPA